MKKVKEHAIEQEGVVLSYYYQHKFSLAYDCFLQEAVEQNPIPEKEPGKRGRAK